MRYNIFKKNALIFPLIFVVAFFWTAKVDAVVSVDQSCMAETYDDFEAYAVNIPSGNLAQTFTPVMNHLNSIKIEVNGDGMGQVGLKLYKGNDFVALAELKNEPHSRGTVSLNFGDIEINTSSIYKIRPYVNSGNANLSWYRENNCYSGGKAFENNASQGYDFAFETYGYDDTIPEIAISDISPDVRFTIDSSADPELADESDDEDSSDDEESADANSDSSDDETALLNDAEDEDATSEDSSQNAATPSENPNLATTTQTPSNLNTVGDNPVSDKDSLKKFFILGYILIVGLTFLGYGIYRHIKKKQINQNINK